MSTTLGVIGELAVVSIALGALLWAIGQERTGKRAIAFGIVLGIVGEALVCEGTAVLAWVCAHRVALGFTMLGAVVLGALLRIVSTTRAGKGEAKLSKKRRVQSSP